MQVWNVLHAARWKYRTQKSRQIRHLRTIAQLCRAVSSQLRHISTIGKNCLNSNISSTCISWGIAANFNGFRVLAALLHGTLVVGVSQSLRRWTVGLIGRAAITLDIGPYSSSPFFALYLNLISYPQVALSLNFISSETDQWTLSFVVHKTRLKCSIPRNDMHNEFYFFSISCFCFCVKMVFYSLSTHFV